MDGIGGDRMGKSRHAAMEDAIIRGLLTSSTLSEAARAAGVSRSTIYDRLKDPEFAERYEGERARVEEMVREKVAEAATEATLSAIAALRAYTEGSGLMVSDTARIRASEALLGFYGAFSRGQRPPARGGDDY